MRRLAFILSILGLALLVTFLLFSKPLPITSQKDLVPLLPNQKVLLTGTVIKASESKLTLDSNLSLTGSFPSSAVFQSKSVSAIGIIDEYPPGNKRIEVLRIKLSLD